MLLAVDIGNTNIEIGVFRGEKLIENWKMKTVKDKTRDEYVLALINLFRFTSLGVGDIDAVIVSSVVPPLTPVFQDLSLKLFKRKSLVVGPGLKTGMSILYENPQEVGADRVVASVAAFEKYGGPCIVVDFGTAITFDAISSKGEYLGGAIAPGIQISEEALFRRTAKLPRVEIKKPKKAIGRTTVASIQSGLFFGYIGLISNIIAHIKKELGSDTRVISTGGFARQITPEIKAIDHEEPHLVLEGLRILYQKNS
ncbi:MAG: type III pantothenate kinase [Candidatus Aminicenantales bacterium]